MTEPAAPPTRKTPEQILAQLIALLASIIYAVIDASHLPRACRRRLRAAFAEYFASLAAQLATPGHHAPRAAKPTRPAKPAKSRANPHTQPAKPRAPAPPRIPRRHTTPHGHPPYLSCPRPDARPAATALITPTPRIFQKSAQTLANSLV